MRSTMLGRNTVVEDGIELWRWDCGSRIDGVPCWHYSARDPGVKTPHPTERLIAYPDAEGRALAQGMTDVQAAMGIDDGNVPRLLGRIMRAVAGVRDAQDGGDRQFVIDQSFAHEDYMGKDGYAPLVSQDRVDALAAKHGPPADHDLVERMKAEHGMGRNPS